MKSKITILSVLILIGISNWSQNKVNKDWIKNPITSAYSLKNEQKFKEDLYIKIQKKCASNVDIQAIDNDIKSVNLGKRLSTVRISGLINASNQISKIEYLLLNDSSFNVLPSGPTHFHLVGTK